MIRNCGWLALSVLVLFFSAGGNATEPQYQSDDIKIAAASASEPILAEFSLQAAKAYLEDGATAWMKSRGCVSCHTNGTYLQMAPALTEAIGEPRGDHREFFVQQIAGFKKKEVDKLKGGITPTQVAYVAHGLASWDAHVTGKLSAETRDALRLMLSLQSSDGSWGNTKCWPPFESSNYQGATVAALALATAPGYLAQLDDDEQRKVQLLKEFLRSTPAPHDYGQVLLLWTATQLDDLLDKERRSQIVEMILSHQQSDGGWSIRSFGSPDSWAGGHRAEKLRSEAEFEDPPSDGHQTGLAVLVLRDAGLPIKHPAIRKGVDWIKSNQRQSGRWWTRSLNTDGPHYITFSGTAYSLVALHKCGELK